MRKRDRECKKEREREREKKECKKRDREKENAIKREEFSFLTLFLASRRHFVVHFQRRFFDVVVIPPFPTFRRPMKTSNDSSKTDW